MLTFFKMKLSRRGSIKFILKVRLATFALTSAYFYHSFLCYSTSYIPCNTYVFSRIIWSSFSNRKSGTLPVNKENNTNRAYPKLWLVVTSIVDVRHKLKDESTRFPLIVHFVFKTYMTVAFWKVTINVGVTGMILRQRLNYGIILNW